jgi:predicted phage terminase large subunit-like protein
VSLARALTYVEDELARRSLHRFVQTYWSVIEPDLPFEDNWHIRTICEHLEAVTSGQIRNLLINVPPGTSKSTLVSVMWPAWEWATRIGHRYFGASYSDTLSIRDATLCRNIITSERYKRAYPQVRLSRSQDQKTNYALDGGGWRLATTVGGRGTGMHPTRKIVDDPHNVKQANSDAERLSALTWFDQTLSSRGMILDAATVVVMQRLHERDVSGHIEKSEMYRKDWDHLLLPMRYEARRAYPTTQLGFKDPRKAEGELLWPKVFTPAKVATLAAALGNYGTAGQLQQRPAPEGSGLIAVDRFKLWAGELPALEFILQSYDTAFTDNTANDPTACVVMAVFAHAKKRCVLLLDIWAEHMDYPEARQKIIDDWKVLYGEKKLGRKPRRADHLLIEDKGSGIAIVQDLNRANVPAVGYNPGRSSKVQRAHLVAPLIEAEVIYLPESTIKPGTAATWAHTFLKQCKSFPNDEHDDMVDCLTQGLRYLRDAGYIDTPVYEEPPPEDAEYRRGRHAPTYG